MVYGLFDGVDVRSEGLVDQFVSKFQQVNLEFKHHFNDKFSINAQCRTFGVALGRPDATADLPGCHRRRQLLAWISAVAAKRR